jgi:hypothetical protein
MFITSGAGGVLDQLAEARPVPNGFVSVAGAVLVGTQYGALEAYGRT